MLKQNPEWEKQLLQREPYEEQPSLDPEALAPYKGKIETLEKELKILDNFLNLYFDAKTKLQRPDFVELFRNLDTVAPPNIDPVAAALSGDTLERTLVSMANRLRHSPLVMGEILTKLQSVGKDEALESVSDYVKTLYLGIVENRKKLLWLLTKRIGIKKSAAIFEEQDWIKERAFPEYLASPEHSASLEPGWKQRFESGDPEVAEIVRLEFTIWYEKNKAKFLMNREEIRKEVDGFAEKLDDQNAYEIIEKHLATTPKEIFELMKNQARISSG